MATTSTTRHIYQPINVVICTIDLASIAAHTTVDQEFQLDGITGRVIQLIEPSDIDGHLTIESASCPSQGRLLLRITNADGSAVDDTGKRYVILCTP